LHYHPSHMSDCANLYNEFNASYRRFTDLISTPYIFSEETVRLYNEIAQQMETLFSECGSYMKNNFTNDITEFNEFRRSAMLGPLEEVNITLYKIFSIRTTILNAWFEDYNDKIKSYRILGTGGRKIKSNKANKHKKASKSKKSRRRH